MRLEPVKKVVLSKHWVIKKIFKKKKSFFPFHSLPYTVNTSFETTESQQLFLSSLLPGISIVANICSAFLQTLILWSSGTGYHTALILPSQV